MDPSNSGNKRVDHSHTVTDKHVKMMGAVARAHAEAPVGSDRHEAHQRAPGVRKERRDRNQFSHPRQSVIAVVVSGS